MCTLSLYMVTYAKCTNKYCEKYRSLFIRTYMYGSTDISSMPHSYRCFFVSLPSVFCCYIYNKEYCYSYEVLSRCKYFPVYL